MDRNRVVVFVGGGAVQGVWTDKTSTEVLIVDTDVDGGVGGDEVTTVRGEKIEAFVCKDGECQPGWVKHYYDQYAQLQALKGASL